MEKMDEKLVQLLKGAMDIFMRYGIRSVTMDDLARHLSISKKTLYKYVTDKNDLVAKVFELHQDLECQTMEGIVKRGLNAIDENFEISQMVINQVKDIHPSIMYDIEKYYPEAMKQFHDYKMDVVMGWVKDNLKRGMAEGYYREDLNIDVISVVYIQRMDDFFHSNLYPPQLSFLDIYLELFRYHIRGIASEKGVEYLKEKVAKENSK
ncbi:TetR/AcrR family transcriptional regulator [bacterium SCSIO 12741]|nr:TetR/AcrR family transcriptional regulator [bacterium SCSIO 12741]